MRYATIKIGAAAIACAFFVGTNAYAVAIGDSSEIGTIESGNPTSTANDVTYANTLLAQVSPSGPTTIAGHAYTRTSNPDPGSGSVSSVGALQGNGPSSTSIPAGYEYVLAQYNGFDAGDVLWYLGGAATTLPANSSPLWLLPSNPPRGRNLTHWTAFNPITVAVPDGGSTLALIGVGLTALGFLRRKLS